MVNNLKNNFNIKFLLKILFYIYPLVMLRPSGYITVYVTFLTIYSFYFFYKNKIKINFFFLDYLVFGILFLSILSTAINVEKSGYFLLIKSILDIRFGLLYLIIRNLFYHKIINYIPIIIITCISTIFLSFDIFIQHIYGQDLFGYKPWYDRYAGIFNDEAIAGSYIQKFAFISIPAILLIKKLNLLKTILVTLIINILGLGILMSTDRVPFIMYLAGITILIIISKKYKILYLINLLLILSLFLLIFQNNSIINKRYLFLNSIKDTVYDYQKKISNHSSLQKNNSTEVNRINNSILKDDYFKIFYTGYEIWKINPIIGTGVKSFTLSCSDAYKNNDKLLCAPHTHNIYLELLVNTGIIGISILMIYISYFLKELKNILIDNNNNVYLYLLIIFICELFPLRSYGSIFQTVNGSMFWYLLALTSTLNFANRS
jgi:O-antigen ligase